MQAQPSQDSFSPAFNPIEPPPRDGLTRRDALRSAFAAAGAAAVVGGSASAAQPATKPDPRRASPKRYAMKKSINLWAFPYPDRMNLRECLQLAKDAGFDGIELNYDLDNDLSPKAGTKEFKTIRQMADQIGIQISGLCSFLFWPYPLTSNDPAKRARGLELAGKIAQAASDLGVENVLVVPGAVHIPWRTDHEPVRNDICEQRAKEAIAQLAKTAAKQKVYLNMENIFFNGFLMTPMEMNAFVDHFGNERVRIHYDTGNIAMFQHAEHWVPVMGQRIQNIHLKEFTKKGTDFSLETFRPLLDGTTNWPALLEELDKINYRGFLTFEYFHPYPHYPEALVWQTSDSLDRILGRKV
ncbi:MAG: hexulose-6-phosphate isomerase [Limisphaerales bacterium]|nr:MAG: hexulose-6-phosphate isomerase [Limisphaerales bacterium]KAG0507422.1 MAG: hexulose-6-phosphate isomerase [Limisphaerales bacterium]TXT51433.1 MAG: hexulose-6-phosphate isomerase [Limisphaerales bacterium]